MVCIFSFLHKLPANTLTSFVSASRVLNSAHYSTHYFSGRAATLNPSTTIPDRSPLVSASSTSVRMVFFSPGISAT